MMFPSLLESIVFIVVGLFCLKVHHKLMYLAETHELFEPIAERLQQTLHAANLDNQRTIEDVEWVINHRNIPTTLENISNKAKKHNVSVYRLAVLLNHAVKQRSKRFEWRVKNRTLVLRTKHGEVAFPSVNAA